MFVNNQKIKKDSDSPSTSTSSLILNLETLKKKYLMTLNQYDQEQKNYFLYLSKFPPGNYIKNGNFSQPSLSTNSFSLFTGSTQVPNWDFQKAAIINQSSQLGYPIPYPNGNQAVSIPKDASISQKINLNIGAYQLSFQSCGRNCCDNSGESNTIQVSLNGKVIYSVLPTNNVWTLYSTNFTLDSLPSDSISTIIFSGTWTTSDRSSAIQNIEINYIGLKSITNNSFIGESSLNILGAEDLQSCMVSCSNLYNKCSGATYNKETNMCSLSTGNGYLVASNNGENTAIVTENLYYLSTLKQLNEQLLSLNNQMKNAVEEGQPIYNDSVKENATSSTYLKNYYKKLMLEREKIKLIMNEYENLSLEEVQSNEISNSSYMIFLFLFLITLFFILFFLFIYNKIGNSSSSTTNSSSSLWKKN